MKIILAGALAAASLAVSAPALAATQTAAPAPADAAKLTEAPAIISVMFPAPERQRMMDKLMADIMIPMRKNLPKIALQDAGLKEIVDDYMAKMVAEERPLIQKHMPDQLEAMAVAYTHEFSLAELKDIRAFANSPSGGHYLSKSLDIVGDPAVMRANTAMMADSQAVQNKLLPEFMHALIGYLQAHPDVAAKVKAEQGSNT